MILISRLAAPVGTARAAWEGPQNSSKVIAVYILIAAAVVTEPPPPWVSCLGVICQNEKQNCYVCSANSS